jgi:hypothetical protein
MRRRLTLFALLLSSMASFAASGGAYGLVDSGRTGASSFFADFSASGLRPYSWAVDGPPLAQLGYGAGLGLEYHSAISVPLRLEIGYVQISQSSIASTGELYRAWDGVRFALTTGYTFPSMALGKGRSLAVSLLAGGALTSAHYSNTSLVYAYPSLLLEPRLDYAFGLARDMGPWLALACELMFRDGTRTFAPGLNFGWRYRLGVR